VATTVSATWAEIASATGLSAGDIRSALAGLHQRRLVSQTSDDPVRHVASSPGTVEAMISNRLRRTARGPGGTGSAGRQAARGSADREAAGVFEVVHGQQALRHHVLHLLHTARSGVINMVKPDGNSVACKQGRLVLFWLRRRTAIRDRVSRDIS
jgi:hypothetical protein